MSFPTIKPETKSTAIHQTFIPTLSAGAESYSATQAASAATAG
ncbi:PE family protein [Mycobacterium cookii]|nr:PE family protein [Mycobacterium cookii]MCV7331187.1 PE family protein [Mycobacterium cookii]